LCARLGVIGALDAAVSPVKQRDRGSGAGEQITPVPGLASTTAAGLARRLTPAQWQAVEAGLAVVTGRMLSLLPAPRAAARAAALAGGPVTIDLDTTDVEVYGRKKRGVAYNHQGQWVGRPHVATWAGRVALRADAGYFAGSWPAPPTRRASACAAVCAAGIAAVMAGRDVTA
jgi:hypothetical protein